MFTIIIPVYNSETTILNTVKNIKKALKNIDHEIIIINDGSTDSTLLQLKNLEQDVMVKIINQENRGVSAARNAGIDNLSTKSKYITFIDDSDSVSNNFFKKNIEFLEKYKHVDLAACQIERVIDGVGLGHSLNHRFLNNEREIVDIIDDYNLIHFHIGGAVFRSTLFLKDGFRFDESITFWEDAKLINSILLDKKIYGLVHQAKYYYDRNNKKSLSYNSWKSIDRYTNHMKQNYMELIEKSITEFGTVIEYVQYLIATHFIQYVIETNKDFIVSKYITNNNEFLKESKIIFNNIDTNIIDKLNAKAFYKKILYKLKDLEFVGKVNEDQIKVLGQKYDFLRQNIKFSLSKEADLLSDDIEIYKIGFFEKKTPAELISFKSYREPIFQLENKYSKIYKVRLTILESFFNQKFYIKDFRRNEEFYVSSKSLASRFFKTFKKKGNY